MRSLGFRAPRSLNQREHRDPFAQEGATGLYGAFQDPRESFVKAFCDLAVFFLVAKLDVSNPDEESQPNCKR